MRHRKAGRQLRRTSEQKLALMRNLATSLNNLSVRLGDLGHPEQALTTIQEAVTIRRKLAERWPDAYQQKLGQSLAVYEWLKGIDD